VLAEGARAGEIIAATSCDFTAQSVRLHAAPPLGSFVRVPHDGLDLYGVVSEARTDSLEAGGRPVARAHGDVLDAAIYRENPDLEHVLRTEFTAVVVGYAECGALRQHLPPLPPPLHYSVYACAAEEIVAFSERLDYLRALLDCRATAADELVAANVRLAAAARPLDESHAFLVRVGRELAVLLRDEYDRLTAVLRRLRPEEARR
jgi:hypothetical protein